MTSSARKESEKKEKSKGKEAGGTKDKAKSAKAASSASQKAKESPQGAAILADKPAAAAPPAEATPAASAATKHPGKTGDAAPAARTAARSGSSKSKVSGGLNSPPSAEQTPAKPPDLSGYHARKAAELRSANDAASKQSSSLHASHHRDPEKPGGVHSGSGFLDSPSRDFGNRTYERDEDLEDDGIVASSRLALARMSFEKCVVAAAHLQDLMMAHAAAVTSAQQRGSGAGLPPTAPRTQVNQVTLSKRPLDEIADDLAHQLWQLCQAYQTSSRAERQLMGVPVAAASAAAAAPSPPPPPVGPPRLSPEQMRALAGGDTTAVPQVVSVPVAAAPSGNVHSLMQGTVREMGITLGDTFGPMASTKVVSPGDELGFGVEVGRAMGTPPVIPVAGAAGLGGGGGFLFGGAEGADAARCAGHWMIDVGQANPGPRLVAQNTQFVYPDGTTVSFPVSTFGELVGTELMSSAAVDDWARAVETSAEDMQGHKRPGKTGFDAGQFTVGDTRKVKTVADAPKLSRTPSPAPANKPTAPAHPNGMDTELLHAYLRSLEAKLTEKQRLDALREARGGTKSKEGRGRISSLTHLAQSKSLVDSHTGGTKK